MRTTVNKEIPRDSLEFGAELGSGEFGSVFEGFRSRYVQLTTRHFSQQGR